MLVIHTNDDLPSDHLKKPSIFLAGPNPRDDSIESWRPKALQLLKDFEGYVFVPENLNGAIIDEDDTELGDLDEAWQKERSWEDMCLRICTCIAMWVPRDLDTMPAFTTNVEFGLHVSSNRLIYGRPDNAPKTKYLDWLYWQKTGEFPMDNLEKLMKKASRFSNMSLKKP